ncbi:PutP Na+/proline symporter [uncultured Caudovirales phage]|uniref:PutP Na+/proline symporter n=1 Tax=uncultured Caudovirales phage TaxID=2100421 RepID=A0A6J7WWP3_9CAUD|nr:PutP Na+/proline symporter [uncultured Caudovirales phage]
MDVNIFPLFSQSTGLVMIALYAAFVFALTSWFAKGYGVGKEAFLVANRNVGFWQGSMSVGASWIWAPGLFVAAQQGFNNGIAGVFWFSIGNFFALILFSFAIFRLRASYGEGFTLSKWFRSKYGRLVQACVLLQTALYALQGITINLFAGSKSVALLTGLSPLLVGVLLVAVAFLYSFRGGLKATIGTDMVKITAIWIGMAIVAVSVFGTVGFEPALAGIGGKTGNGTSLFGNEFVLGLLFGFGIPTMMGHLASPWSDNAMYQNAFSMKNDYVRGAFVAAPFYWLVLPIVGGLLGMTAAGLHYQVDGPNTSFINLYVMANVVGWGLPLIYLAVVFAGLVSIIDTQLLSSANLAGNDVHDSFYGNDPVKWGKYGMMILAALGVGLANIPGLDLNMIFVFGKTLTLTFFVPIVLALLGGNLLTRNGFLAGGFVGLFIGAPIFVYGQFFGGGPQIMTLGVLVQTLGSGAASYLVSKLSR